MPARKILDKDEIYELYINQNKSKAEVAEILGVTEKTLGKYFKKFGIKKSVTDIVKRREETCLKNFGSKNPMHNEASRQKLRENHISKGYIKTIPYEELYDALVNKKMLITKATDFFGVSTTVIRRLAKENNIEICKEELKTVSKEDLYDYYINQKHTAEECCQYFNMSRSHLRFHLRKYGIFKDEQDILEIKKRRMMEEHGVEYALQNPESINKQKETYKNRTEEQKRLSREKSKQTFLKNFGADNPLKLDEIKNKIYQTNIEKYGVKIPTQNPEVRKKFERTMVDRFGVNNPSLVPEFQEKRKRTMQEKWGVDNYGELVLSEEVRGLINNKERLVEYIKSNNLATTYDIAESIGCSISTIHHRINDFELQDLVDRSQSRFETEISNILTNWNIWHFKTRQVLESRLEIDFYCPNQNVGIEFNGNWTHCSINKGKYYHYDKSMDAQNQGIRFIHIYEYEWEDPVKRSILLSLMRGALGLFDTRVYARNCEIQEIDNDRYRKFCIKNHVQGYRQARVIYGLIYDGELVQVMSFSHSKNYEWEIIRECTKCNTVVVGGVSKLFSYFIKTNHPKEIFSYCDFNKFNGKGYETLGMKFIGYTSPDMKWYMKDNTVVNRQPTKNKELKEKAIAQIWGAGSKKYLWTKPVE